MRKTLAFALGGICIALLIAILAFTARSLPPSLLDTHRIGDVVYSILDSATFNREHGGTWTLLDGRPIPETSRLKRIYKSDNVPDGRGVFLRGMNVGRGKDTGDTDGDQRAVGAWQGDDFKSHDHNIRFYRQTGPGEAGGMECSVNQRLPTTPIGTPHGAEQGGLETRSRNIAIYLYIKIKD